MGLGEVSAGDAQSVRALRGTQFDEHSSARFEDVRGGGGEALKSESARLVKEFLSQNLGTLFQSEIRGAVQKELQAFMASENMKMLIDDKFRTVQLYLTTEVIPNTVKQILRKLSQQQTA